MYLYNILKELMKFIRFLFFVFSNNIFFADIIYIISIFVCQIITPSKNSTVAFIFKPHWVKILQLFFNF